MVAHFYWNFVSECAFTRRYANAYRNGFAQIQVANAGEWRRFRAARRVAFAALHAAERVRVDGDEAQQLGDDAREGLLLACRGLSEYVDVQLRVA